MLKTSFARIAMGSRVRINPRPKHKLTRRCGPPVAFRRPVGRQRGRHCWREAIRQKPCEWLRWRDGPEAPKAHRRSRKLPSPQLEALNVFSEKSNLRRTGGDSSLDGFALSGSHSLRSWLHPQVSIECAVLHGLGQVFGFEVFGALEIRDSARNF